jgi:putative toxin-antitoxin system antitoxin component (TIGR02293 family)
MATLRKIRAPIMTADRLLGGTAVLKRQPHSLLDWVSLVRQGLPTSVVDEVTKAVQLTQAELSTALGIPERTLIRRKKEGVLSPEESTKLLRLARVVQRAVEVFEDTESAIDWLKTANRSLRGFSPLALLDTDIGTESVLDTLGRIEHGVFA